MAFQLAVPEKDLCCPVCLGLFKDPVLLACSHSCCKACLQQHWAQKVVMECPVCREVSKISEPPCNQALKDLCEGMKPSTPAFLCSLHSEKLNLFCVDDQQPACVVCQTSKRHKNHAFSPIDEATQDYKDQLEKAMKPLKEKLESFSKFKENFDNAAKHLVVQTQQTEAQIKAEFEKLHSFLQDEERSRIAALREDVEERSLKLKKNTDRLIKHIHRLSDQIRALEEDLRAEDIVFLQNYKASVDMLTFTMPDPELVSGVLIDVAKHLGNLSFKVWEKMQEKICFTPVILDPNNANPNLLVSKDLTSVRLGDITQPLPDNPERFDKVLCVLGSEGFHSKTHSWDVDVADSTLWALGVMKQCVQRKGYIYCESWTLTHLNGEYTAECLKKTVAHLRLKQKPKKIRIELDQEKGKLAFSDPDSNTPLYTFRHTFTETFFPLIANPCPINPVRILPMKVCVTNQQQSYS